MSDDIPGYIEGAKFIEPGAEVDQDLWPRCPSKYVPTRKFQQRFKDLGSIVTEDDVTGAIRYGEVWPSARATISFVNDLGGVVIYVVASSDLKSDEDLEVRPSESQYPDLQPEDFYYTLVTLWPYVYDRERAWGTGRWSGQQLDEIEEIQPVNFQN